MSRSTGTGESVPSTSRAPALVDRLESWLPWCVALGLAIVAGLRVVTARLALFDTAVTVNVYWRLAHGLDDQTALTGSHHLADHLSPLYLMLTPVFRLPSPLVLVFLYSLQAISVALVGVAVRQVAVHLDLPRHLRIVLIAAASLGPGAYLVANFGVREYNLGVGLLAMACSAVIRDAATGRARWWAVAAALTRVEYAVAVLILGLVGRRYGRAGRAVLQVGVASSVVLVGWLVLSPLDGPSVGYHFAHLGATPGDALLTAFRSPADLVQPILDGAWLRACVGWLVPFGLVLPFLAPRWLLPSLPSIAIPILGVWPPADAYAEHYWYPLLALVPLAVAVALAERRRWWQPVVMALPVLGLVSWMVFFPWSQEWLLPGPAPDPDAVTVARESNFGQASVSAPSPVVQLLADRPVVYAFPRPMSCSSEGVAPFVPSQPARYVIVTPGLLALLDQAHPDRSVALATAAEVAEPLAGPYLLVDTAKPGGAALGPCALD